MSKDQPGTRPIKLKLLRPKSGDLLVVKSDSGLDKEAFVEELSRTFRYADFSVVFVKSLSDIRLLSPEQLGRITGE